MRGEKTREEVELFVLKYKRYGAMMADEILRCIFFSLRCVDKNLIFLKKNIDNLRSIVIPKLYHKSWIW